MRSLKSYWLTLPLAAGAVSLLAMIATTAGAQSPAGSIDLVAVDTDVAGNTPTTVGDIQVCSDLAVGATRDVDIVVRGIPPVSADGGGMEGFHFTVLYDERFVRIVDYDVAGQLIGSVAGSNIVDFTDAVPSEDGLMVIAAADFATGADESGNGVLARLTVEGVGAGTSDLVFMGDALVNDVATQDQNYVLDTLNGGLIAVGVTCDPNATPPPSPLPTGGPPTGIPPEDSPGPTGDGEESPGGTAGSTGTGGPDDGPTGTGDATTSPGNGAADDDDGGSSLALIIAIIAILIVLGGGGAYLFLRRRETPAS